MSQQPRWWRAVVLALALSAVAGSGCRSRGRAAAGPFPEAPVVLVSIDTLRADRLPRYGYARGATPALDALADEGIMFEQVYSHVPLTLPAHASMLTGLLPPRHGVRDNEGFALAREHRTLATRFRSAGRPTGAAVSAFVVRAATGLAEGFDFYDDALEVDLGSESLGAQQRDGAVAVESLLAWIESQGGRPFFAFLHLYEPHTPYSPPPAHRGHASPYDGEVAYADELLGRFFARLRASGVLDRSIVAVTSDHGEGLGDHGEQEHGMFLYREAVRVPLLVRLPGAAWAGRRVGGVHAQVDLAPTLLDMAGLEAGGMDGVSLRGMMGGNAGAVPPRPVYSETYYPRYHFGWSELLSVTDERFRYVRAPRPELFDLSADAAETRNLAADKPAVVSAMQSWLEGAVPAGVATPGAVSAEVQERLRALGYAAGGPAVAPAGTALPDPKDRIAVHEAYRQAVSLRGQGRHEEAARALRAVLAAEPGLNDAWEMLGLTLERLGREKEALAALERVVAADPRRASAHLALTRINALAGRSSAADRHAQAASLIDPGRGFETLALIQLERGRLEEAAANATRSLQADRDRAMSHFVLGAVAQREGRCPQALEAYSRAQEVSQRRKGLIVRNLHAGMADCLARLGREAEAEREFLAEIASIPHTREGRVGLAMLYRSQGRDQQARDALAGVVTAHPRAGAEEYWTVVRTLAVLGDASAARQWASRARTLFPRDPRFRG